MEVNQLLAAIPQNSVQVKQELKKQESGDENYFYQALESKKILNASLDDLRNCLKWVMVKIGLRSANWPSDEEKAILIDHILREYKGHTCDEIKLAFEMAITGKLDVDANCYENFSCLYVSKIMNAYRTWARQAYHHLPKKETMLLEENKTITDDEMNDWLNEWKSKIRNVNNPMLVPPTFYAWMNDTGILNLTKEQKRDYIDKAVHLRQFNLSEQAKMEGVHGEAQKQLNVFSVMRNKGEFEGEEVFRLREIAKKISVFEWLKSNSDERSR